MVRINSGAPEPTDKFNDTPRDRWGLLLIAKRLFLGRRLEHDCRCLIEFCQEAKDVYTELGYASSEQMIREGYELDPSQIELAVAWLNENKPDKPVGMGEIVALNGKPGKPKGSKGGNQHTVANVDNINKSKRLKGGTDTEYTLRRLARDAPEMLDRIETGELSVNAAAIQAGIRKKPRPEEVIVKAFRKTENRLEAIKMILGELKEHERQMLIEILREATP